MGPRSGYPGQAGEGDEEWEGGLGLEADRGPSGPSSLAPSLMLHPRETVFCEQDILRAMAARANGDGVSGAGEDHPQPQE